MGQIVEYLGSFQSRCCLCIIDFGCVRVSRVDDLLFGMPRVSLEICWSPLLFL